MTTKIKIRYFKSYLEKNKAYERYNKKYENVVFSRTLETTRGIRTIIFHTEK